MKFTNPVHKTEGLIPAVGSGADQGVIARVSGKATSVKFRERDVPRLGNDTFIQNQQHPLGTVAVVIRAVNAHGDVIPGPAVAADGMLFLQGTNNINIPVKAVLFPLPVMRRAGAENSDMIISSSWYTSGKL
uniref:Uncharacterized protein n=1 Tax=Escherichia coli TaxID=562 RepID=A0A6M4NZR7_ECOLX|nr:hypothetical protein G6854_00026 [Escherichia coli]